MSHGFSGTMGSAVISHLKASVCRPLVDHGEVSCLFKLALLLNTCLVRHTKEQCQRLPPLKGPTVYRIEPTARERETYNDLVQLMQRNLFCTYYCRKNKVRWYKRMLPQHVNLSRLWAPLSLAQHKATAKFELGGGPFVRRCRRHSAL